MTLRQVWNAVHRTFRFLRPVAVLDGALARFCACLGSFGVSGWLPKARNTHHSAHVCVLMRSWHYRCPSCAFASLLCLINFLRHASMVTVRILKCVCVATASLFLDSFVGLATFIVYVWSWLRSAMCMFLWS